MASIMSAPAHEERMSDSELSDNVVWAGYCKVMLLQILKYWGLNKRVDINIEKLCKKANVIMLFLKVFFNTRVDLDLYCKDLMTIIKNSGLFSL